MTDPSVAVHRRAVLFPGQGSQFVGMAADLVESYPVARQLFDVAGDQMGQDLAAICAAGPREKLNSTEFSQPAIFVASMAVLQILEHSGGGHLLRAQATAGLSLGEYSALVFAGSLRFEDALEVVIARGKAMQRACDRVEGTMTSILGLELDQVREAVQSAQAEGVVAIANVNATTQIVISGEIAAVNKAAESAREMGARRIVELEVAGAYHSPLMSSATEELTPMLEKLQIEPPRLRFYPNVLAQPVDEPSRIRECLLQQIESPVLWQPTLQQLVGDGLDEVIEPGPGKVVAGLLKQVDRGIPTHSILARESIEEILEGTVT